MFGINPRPPRAAPAPSAEARPSAETRPEPERATVEFFARQGVGLTRVASSGWLIRATSAPAPELSVLGCVQDHGSEFELMELEGGFRWTTHGSLHAAVAHLLTDARVQARIDGAPYPPGAGASEDARRAGVVGG